MSKTEITYRKTKNGEWVAYGPYSELQNAEGAVIAIRRKDGSTATRVCRKIGKPFRVDGIEMVYAYLEGRGARSARHAGPGRAARNADQRGACIGHMTCPVSAAMPATPAMTAHSRSAERRGKLWDGD